MLSLSIGLELVVRAAERLQVVQVVEARGLVAPPHHGVNVVDLQVCRHGAGGPLAHAAGFAQHVFFSLGPDVVQLKL